MTNTLKKEIYQTIYEEFITKQEKAEVIPSEVGKVLTKIAGLFPNYNASLILAEKSYALITRDIVTKTDEITGKAMTSSKATTIAEASDEAFLYKKARSHVQNIEVMIGALKFLQKSLETEYIQSNL